MVVVVLVLVWCLWCLCWCVMGGLQRYGALVAGMVFTCGWFVWVDAVVFAGVQAKAGTAGWSAVPWDQFIPGALGTAFLGMLVMGPRRDSLNRDGAAGDVYVGYGGDDAGGCGGDGQGGIKAFLFLTYLVAFASVVGSVWVLIEFYGAVEGAEVYPGIAGVVQCALIVASAVTLWISQSGDHDDDVGLGMY